MKFIISLFILFATTPSAPDYPNRVDSHALQRMSHVFPYVRQVELNTDVPPRILLGTIYNESSAVPVVKGDGGISYGLGQIRCFWVRELHTPVLRYCHELLTGWKNVYVIGEIFQHLKERYPDKSWRELVKLYHLGSQALLTEIDDSRYINRTFRFGKIFLPYYEASKTVDDKLDKMRFVKLYLQKGLE